MKDENTCNGILYVGEKKDNKKAPEGANLLNYHQEYERQKGNENIFLQKKNRTFALFP